jgi:hypothetical protein
MIGEAGKQQLEIIGLEVGPKTSNHRVLIKNAYSSNGPKLKLSRIDQTMLQLPKRTTFMTNRKVQENLYARYRILDVDENSLRTRTKNKIRYFMSDLNNVNLRVWIISERYVRVFHRSL